MLFFDQVQEMSHFYGPVLRPCQYNCHKYCDVNKLKKLLQRISRTKDRKNNYFTVCVVFLLQKNNVFYCTFLSNHFPFNDVDAEAILSSHRSDQGCFQLLQIHTLSCAHNNSTYRCCMYMPTKNQATADNPKAWQLNYI